MSAIRAVLDTNILISALLSPLGNPAKIYRMFLTGDMDLVVSEGILEEYEDVLYRPRLKIRTADADIVLSAIRQYAETVQPITSDMAIPDEEDRVFYDTAKTAGVYLVTGNTKHFPQELFIVTPSEFVASDNFFSFSG
jgi:putative PIN family toxin of toxin-antitoxin system